MTRRTIIFTNDNGERYATPEFNGDKSEFIMFHDNYEACNADWPEIFAEFDSVKTLADFRAASERAQLHYRSFINKTEVEREILPVSRYGAEINSAMRMSGNIIMLN